jgi:putative solute:sodium symporter small subunit
MSQSDNHRAYWRKNLRMTALLLLIWLATSFAPVYFVRELNEFTFLGFPLGFYMTAQGSLIIYVALVWFYSRYMNRLDHKHSVAED